MNKVTKAIKLFFYKNEYQLLELSGIFGAFLIVLIANYFFVSSKMFYLILLFGLFVGSFGFIIEYFIKQDKKKSIETEYGYFLSDLSKEYRKTNNMSLSLSNLLESNFYGSINLEIKRLSNRVSWGESFEESLKSINENINSPIIDHSLSLLNVLKDSAMTYDKVLLNISKDINIFKSETRSKKYFKNLFNLSIVFYFLFILILIYIDFIIGKNFLWFSGSEEMTRVFFDNFLLYIGLLLAFFTAFVMYSINSDRPIVLLKYVSILFLITIILFQVFIPKPDADEVLIDTINYLVKHNSDKEIEIDQIIAIKSISSKLVVDKTGIESLVFINNDSLEKEEEFGLIIENPLFFNFLITKKSDLNYVVYYNVQE